MMQTVGIVCEYNPLHLGHQRQYRLIREKYGAACGIVCIMSDNYVQRGEPAVFDKSLRAEAAVTCGADLVLELPVEGCLSSAEGFAALSVNILSGLCDTLSFGAESMDENRLFQLAEMLEAPAFHQHLKAALATGCSFPAARQIALERSGWASAVPEMPNDVLALEYCRAILNQCSKMTAFPVKRENNYHSPECTDFPSATAVRARILAGKSYTDYIPESAISLFANAVVHDRRFGEKAILYRLRTMSDMEYEALPYGSEGLWRRFMHFARECTGTEQLIASVKTKRYTYTRISRMLMCACLGITQDQLKEKPPYVRILAFNDKGRQILQNYKGSIPLVNAGTRTRTEYEQREYRFSDLYGLFADKPETGSTEPNRRISYI